MLVDIMRTRVASILESRCEAPEAPYAGSLTEWLNCQVKLRGPESWMKHIYTLLVSEHVKLTFMPQGELVISS